MKARGNAYIKISCYLNGIPLMHDFFDMGAAPA